jgi:hypothetical protein
MTRTLAIRIKNSGALKALSSLAERYFIKIDDGSHAGSPALPGGPLRLKAHRNWITDAENAPIMDLKEAKAKWINQAKVIFYFVPVDFGRSNYAFGPGI